MRLCYVAVDGSRPYTAFFTRKPLLGLTRQWGDDWGDSRDNAGPPYDQDEGMWLGIPPTIMLRTPYSEASVEEINAGYTAWLKIPIAVWSRGDKSQPGALYAGATPDEYMKFMIYAAQIASVPNPDDLINIARGLLAVTEEIRGKKKIQAIKNLRDATKCGLKEGKEAVEAIWDEFQ